MIEINFTFDVIHEDKLGWSATADGVQFRGPDGEFFPWGAYDTSGIMLTHPETAPSEPPKTAEEQQKAVPNDPKSQATANAMTSGKEQKPAYKYVAWKDRPENKMKPTYGYISWKDRQAMGKE